VKKSHLKRNLFFVLCFLFVLSILLFVWWYFGQRIRLIEENMLKPKTSP
jgi:cytoskeletal protein RodZ